MFIAFAIVGSNAALAGKALDDHVLFANLVVSHLEAPERSQIDRLDHERRRLLRTYERRRWHDDQRMLTAALCVADATLDLRDAGRDEAQRDRATRLLRACVTQLDGAAEAYEAPHEQIAMAVELARCIGPRSLGSNGSGDAIAAITSSCGSNPDAAPLPDGSPPQPSPSTDPEAPSESASSTSASWRDVPVGPPEPGTPLADYLESTHAADQALQTMDDKDRDEAVRAVNTSNRAIAATQATIAATAHEKAALEAPSEPDRKRALQQAAEAWRRAADATDDANERRQRLLALSRVYAELGDFDAANAARKEARRSR